eukprot:3660693-Pyramimonas_sp.AAC.1
MEAQYQLRQRPGRLGGSSVYFDPAPRLKISGFYVTFKDSYCTRRVNMVELEEIPDGSPYDNQLAQLLREHQNDPMKLLATVFAYLKANSNTFTSADDVLKVLNEHGGLVPTKKASSSSTAKVGMKGGFFSSPAQPKASAKAKAPEGPSSTDARSSPAVASTSNSATSAETPKPDETNVTDLPDEEEKDDPNLQKPNDGNGGTTEFY